jgi:hypothetical protein
MLFRQRITMRTALRTAVAGFAVLSALVSAQAYERLPAEQWTLPYSDPLGAIPACAAPEVISFIQSRFADNEASYWNSNLAISAIERVHAIGYRAWGLDFIPRRFCTGVALTTDGKHRQIDYSVIQDAGFAGYSWNVRWCVSGTDRQLAYAPDCKMARP